MVRELGLFLLSLEQIVHICSISITGATGARLGVEEGTELGVGVGGELGAGEGGELGAGEGLGVGGLEGVPVGSIVGEGDGCADGNMHSFPSRMANGPI